MGVVGTGGSRALLGPAVLGSGVFLLVLPVYGRLSSGPDVAIRGENDLPGALVEAEWSSLVPFRPPAPHFLLPALVRLIATVLDLRAAMVAVCAAALAAAFGGIAALPVGRLTERTPRAAWVAPAVAGLVFFSESPALLLPVSSPGSTPWWGRSSLSDIQHWVSPTSVLAIAVFMPFASATVSAAIRVRDDDPIPSGRLALIAVMSALLALAKPTLALPAVAAVVVIAGGTHRAALRLGAAATVPAVAVVGWQTWFLLTGGSPFDSQGGWRVRPFWVFGQAGMDRPAFYLSLLAVPLMAWASTSRMSEDPYVRFVLVVWGIAQVPTLLLQETGEQAGDANFTTGSQMSYFILFAVTMRWYVADVVAREPSERFGRRDVVALVYLVAALTAGVVAYLDAAGLIAWQ